MSRREPLTFYGPNCQFRDCKQIWLDIWHLSVDAEIHWTMLHTTADHGDLSAPSCERPPTCRKTTVISMLPIKKRACELYGCQMLAGRLYFPSLKRTRWHFYVQMCVLEEDRILICLAIFKTVLNFFFFLSFWFIFQSFSEIFRPRLENIFFYSIAASYTGGLQKFCFVSSWWLFFQRLYCCWCYWHPRQTAFVWQ